MEVENRKVNCKSIMGVMSLGLAPNTPITLTVNGSDEKELVEDLSRFLAGESGECQEICKVISLF